MRTRRIVTAAAVALCITASLTSVLFLAGAALGTPFPPFDIFDWTTRRLPGGLVTFGIDSMVAVIRTLNLGETSTVAKLAERTLAILGFLALGTLVGALIILLVRGSDRRIVWKGIAAGVVLGVVGATVSLSVDRPSNLSAIASTLWIVTAFGAWGAAAGWSRARLYWSAHASATPQTLETETIDRRRFLIRLGGATAVITVAGAAVGSLLSGRRRAPVVTSGAWSASNALPNAGSPVQPAPGTRPELTPVEDHYRIDINVSPPSIDEADWRLRITGLVEQPLELTLDQLRTNYEPTHQFITLACISNRIGGDLTSTTRWTGVSLMRLLEQARIRPDATHLRIRSADDFHETLGLDVVRADERVMLTYAWDGLPLATEHGFPLRVYIPDRFGMKQPKWIESIEAIAEWEPGYWVRRGWDREARMVATSVIDTVATDMMLVDATSRTLIPIGGIAHAGARGISRVEVKVDDGEWQQARLREPLSELTWVIWRFDWPFQAGRHTFTVRSFERDGTPQIATDRPIRPSGATGLFRLEEML
jgi:DMSO/TMAO reductase YedYZ molybdopterin-dependent catalytic subunit